MNNNYYSDLRMHILMYTVMNVFTVGIIVGIREPREIRVRKLQYLLLTVGASTLIVQLHDTIRIIIFVYY